jgi:hypothetical protein
MRKLTETELGYTITPPIITSEIVYHKTYTTEGKTFRVNDQASFEFMQGNSRLENAFREFHNANPHVYKQLVELACQLRARGRERYGIKSLFEVIRWHKALETTDEDFKLNNNHAPYYARMIMETIPELNGFFRLRVLKSEREF